MKISRLIDLLERAQQEFGDVEVGHMNGDNVEEVEGIEHDVKARTVWLW